MTNLSRGEVTGEIAGRTFTVAFTIGMLAELEEAVGAKSFKDLQSLFEAPRTRDLLKALPVILKGHEPPADEAWLASLKPVHFSECIRLLNRAFAAGFDAEAVAEAEPAAEADQGNASSAT